ncbi:hypothetical protein FQN60_006969 [Etheostoma spectabile]|uniref:Uncharacterized protein n=1 Tax=Etheostoma spectabile TaxID=54343 RepID=A0A5J5CH84_9PERO|nr:hypothetical protein FQN60_006969 [Etheostoma spectabile]
MVEILQITMGSVSLSLKGCSEEKPARMAEDKVDYTYNNNYKIPILYHKYKERVDNCCLYLGLDGRKFPLFSSTAPSVLHEALSLSCSDNLLEAFFHYISATEKDVLTRQLATSRGRYG